MNSLINYNSRNQFENSQNRYVPSEQYSPSSKYTMSSLKDIITSFHLISFAINGENFCIFKSSNSLIFCMHFLTKKVESLCNFLVI